MIPYYEDDLATLYNGDCREVAEWLTADVLVTDPPYGVAFRPRVTVGGRYGERSTAKVAGDETTSVRDEALARWGSDRPWLMFGSWRQPLLTAHTRIVWDKGAGVGMGNLSVPWRPSTEDIYIGGRWPEAESLGRGGGRRTSGVVSMDTMTRNLARDVGHPTPKPVPLMYELVRRFPPGVVADPFAGSGSTLVAAKALGRKAIGVELDERYCEVAANRLAQGALFGDAS